MDIPLTSFIDFVLKSGGPKMTCAKKIKTQISEIYDPAGDYYKRFREAIQSMHSKGLDKTELSKLIGPLPDSKKENFRAMVVGYKKFMGSKTVEWFQPPRKIWSHGEIKIPINPELGLIWDNTKHVIKLYLKSEKPSKDRFSSILALMKNSLALKDCKYGLLDVRNSKLYLFEDNMLLLIPLVEGEARSLELILNRI